MTIKVWLLYVLISMPGMPSVKNNSFLYPNEEECMQALTTYLNIYESKPLEYKDLDNFILSQFSSVTVIPLLIPRIWV